MDQVFWGKLALSFLVGSAWVALSTAAAERHGSTIGGLIGGLPSTVFVSLLFIGITQSPQVAAETTTLMPFTQGVNGVFVLVYLFIAGHGLVPALVGAFAAWCVMAGIVATAVSHAFSVSIAGWLLLSTACYVAIQKYMRIPPRPQLLYRCTWPQLFLRAVFGGTVIAIAVFTSKLIGPVYGGILAIFPATFFSTLAITHRTGGAEFSRSVGKALVTSGMVNATLYTIAVRYLYPLCGLALGTGLALGFSAGTAYVTYRFMQTQSAVQSL